MKKIFTILVIALGFMGCSKEQIKNENAHKELVSVLATTGDGTKTTLASDCKVLWSAGDKISIGDKIFTLTSGEGTTVGKFEGEAPADGTYDVFYPSSYTESGAWPAQNYVSPDDISGAPMKATATVSEGVISSLEFSNLGGILNYTIKGTETIRKIIVKADDGLDIALDCGTEGVALTSQGAPFKISVPVGNYTNAELVFLATNGKEARKTASTMTITKNKVLNNTITGLSFSEFIDLGVSVKWAKWNLGASSPEEYGNYYAWGAVQKVYDLDNSTNIFQFYAENPDAGRYLQWNSIYGFRLYHTPFYSYNESCYKKYIETDYAVLLSTDDAATVANSNWRIPSTNEFKELAEDCVWVWTDNYSETGTSGCIVYKAKISEDKGKAFFSGAWKKWTGSEYVDDSITSKTYTISDAHIFLPAAGYGEHSYGEHPYRKFKGILGRYWSRTIQGTTDIPYDTAYSLRFQADGIIPQAGNYRYFGYPIRAVMD